MKMHKKEGKTTARCPGQRDEMKEVDERHSDGKTERAGEI